MPQWGLLEGFIDGKRAREELCAFKYENWIEHNGSSYADQLEISHTAGAEW